MSVIYKRYFFFRILSLVIIIFLLQSQTSQAANRYWVFKNFYENDFSSSIKLSEWQLIEDDGTGSFSLSDTAPLFLLWTMQLADSLTDYSALMAVRQGLFRSTELMDR
jgi:hypothetical protein